MLRDTPIDMPNNAIAIARAIPTDVPWSNSGAMANPAMMPPMTPRTTLIKYIFCGVATVFFRLSAAGKMPCG
jgi:hypothetical protein